MFLPVFCNFHSLQEMAPFNYFEKNIAGGGGGGGRRKGCSLVILPWWVSRLLINTFGKGGALEKYPTHFKKITSYAFLLISKILWSVSPRGLVTMYGLPSGKRTLLGWATRRANHSSLVPADTQLPVCRMLGKRWPPAFQFVFFLVEDYHFSSNSPGHPDGL